MRVVWIVKWDSYRPVEVDSIWEEEADARKRADKLGGSWEVACMDLYEEGDDGPPDD
jgi:hypothetical protein